MKELIEKIVLDFVLFSLLESSVIYLTYISLSGIDFNLQKFVKFIVITSMFSAIGIHMLGAMNQILLVVFTSLCLVIIDPETQIGKRFKRSFISYFLVCGITQTIVVAIYQISTGNIFLNLSQLDKFPISLLYTILSLFMVWILYKSKEAKIMKFFWGKGTKKVKKTK